MDTNPQSEVAIDPVTAIQGILERDSQPVEEQMDDGQEQQAAEETTEEVIEDSAPEGEEDDGYEEVEYEGKAYNLPKELKDAVLRQADYTRKTQEVAEQRRLVEAQQEAIKAQETAFREQAAFHQVVMQDMAELKATENTLNQYKQVDWAGLSDSDPVQAQKLWFSYQQLQTKMAELQGGIQTKHQQFQQQQQQSMQAAIQKGVEALKKDIPNWTPETAKELREAGKQFYGFTDAELGQVYDPRIVKLLHDAAQYRKLQSAKPEINKRVSTAPKIVRPGAQPTNKARQQASMDEARLRLKKSGKTEDAARLIAKMI